MQYTLKRAKEVLVESSNAYGQNDLRRLINKAIQDLSGMAGWEQLRKVLRFSSVGPCFVLPQGCAGIVRACLNGKPATVRAQDFRFLLSGPGDIDRPPSGFMPLRTTNVLDLGMKPVMFEPRGCFYLFASSPAGSVDPVLTIKGLTPDGELRALELTAQRAPVYDTSTGELVDGVPYDEMTLSSVALQQIVEVTVSGASEYITLHAASAVSPEYRTPIAIYNPEVDAPEFRHYSLSGVRPDQPVELLVECRIDPLPLVLDTDIIPFSSLNPIEWMIRGDWMMRAGEVDNAQKYYNQAAAWLRAQEITKGTIQTSLVVNSAFDNSLGEVSMDSVNI